MTFLGLKWGHDLYNQAAHPHQEFPGVPPTPPSWDKSYVLKLFQK